MTHPPTPGGYIVSEPPLWRIRQYMDHEHRQALAENRNEDAMKVAAAIDAIAPLLARESRTGQKEKRDG